ncbi:MAG TPA: aldo/keto reductase [Ideonella sp.]|uniref:aldo/keto reductase n=1 Tax=Ideonella sp. TaxID=1929293 RepID=UPI002B5CB7DA|nr:aldo/keto reductase [Ideonella sp.]HSI52216.1 aldo/keto reductase [Ideonella sp.]
MNDLKLSPIVAGAWRLSEWQLSVPQRLAWIAGCIERGLTSFDHADIYGGYEVEALFGEALAAKPGLRNQMQLISKCGIKLTTPNRPSHAIKSYDSSAAHVRASVEASLKALHTDRLDLLLIHRPDLLLDADELARCFEQLRSEGKVLNFGVSNFTASQFALLNSRFPLLTHQLECSPLHLDPLDDGTFDQLQQLRLRPMIWSPLAGGRLFTGTDERSLAVRTVLAEMGERLGGASATTLALAWLLRLPCHPIPVIGSRRLEAADEAMAATKLELSAEDWYRIWMAGAGREVA